MKKTIVVYSGRFQPFHPGHFGMYQHLVKKFGKENVFIGTSNKVESEKSPFNFKEKQEIITTLFKVPKDNVIQVKNPYKPTEILSKYQPSDTSYLTVVSEKDADRFKGKYFRKWEGTAEVGYEDGGYLYVGPMFAKSVSASDVRKNLSNGTDEDKQEFFKKVYPKLDKKIYKLITSKLNEVITIKKEIIEQWLITHGASALNEGTNTFGGGAVDDGPLGFFRDFNVFDKIATKRAKHIGYTVLDMIDKDHITDTTDHPDYPNGPTKAVSYYPAGVIGKISANNQIDVYSSDAYSKWYKHMTRKAGLVGYQVVQSQLMSDERAEIKDLSGSDAKSVKDLASEFATMMHESIELPVEIGDTILTGKWRNKKTIVKSIGKNEYGMPTINGKNVVNFKMVKEGNLVDLEPQMNSLTEAQNKLGLKVPSNIQKLHKLFKKNGYKLYIVGGAVRDAILGKNPHDFDLTTDAKPDEVLKIAKSAGLHTSEVGKQFGIVIVDGDEIATFRKDSIGTKRMQTTVDYTDIQGDVARRDLTINALFYDLDTKEIVDLVGGIADLKSKTIRTVGVAEDRFNEDPLRKLRALRFNARVNGKLHHETLLALKKDPSLTGVSPERIRDEFIKSIESAKSVKNYLDLNDKLGFSKLILPGLKVSKPNIDENDHELLLSMLLRDNDSRMLSKTLNKLKYSSKEIKNITFLQSLIDFKDENIADYKRAQSKTSLLPEQIKKFGKYISKDFSKLLKFKLSVSGNDAPKGTKGKDIKTWIDHQEFSRFQNENIQLVETIEKFIKVVNRGILKEDMTKDDLVSVEKSADANLKPIDVKFTRHFLDRVNDPRNGKEITKPELINFFKRLSRSKKHFSVFLDKYREIMVKDNQTKINIPFVQQANKLIAKTIMRTANWRQNKTAEFKFESVSKAVQTMLNTTPRGIKYIKLDQNGKKLSNWATLKTSASIHKEVDYMNSKYERSEFTHDGASVISYVDVKTGKLYAQWVRGKDNIFTYNHSLKPIKGITESVESNPTITILVGPPASGKSTWVNKNKKNSIIISRDDIVEKHAKNHGITYNETFGNKEIQKAVNTELESHTVKTIKSGKDIIVDMTNMSKKSRSRMLNRVPDNYTKNAVVFNVPKSELIKRLDNREKETGKHIPLNVIDDMIKRFEQPTKDEFDNVTNENFIMENKQVKTFKELLRMMPTKIQKLVMDLKNTPQSAEHHPEGNVLKHTITVVNRALKHAPGDMDLAVAAMFHDLGKATTAGTNKKGNITHYGHENESRKYVKQFSSEIEKLGANPKNVLYIVGNHMRMHQFDNMRQTKKDMMIAHDQFKQLQKFASKIDGGGLNLDKEPKNESITDLVNDLMENLEDFVLPEIKLHEGGAATGGSPIPAEHGMPMYNDVVSKLMSLVKIDKSDARPLGSTGKKAKGQLSGDIDIALNGTKIASQFGLKFDEVSDFLFNKVKGTFKNAVQMKGLGITSFLFPIPESDEFGQVDLMLTDNMDLSTFMFHSPNFIKNESKYKGLYRNALLFSITKYMDANMKPEHFENGDVKKFQKYTLSQKKGLITQIKSYEGKLGKQLKNCKPIKGCDVVVANTPVDIVKYIFGDEYTIDDMKSFESIYKIVKSSKFKHKKHFSKIMSTFKDTIIKGKKMPLPSELD